MSRFRDGNDRRNRIFSRSSDSSPVDFEQETKADDARIVASPEKDKLSSAMAAAACCILEKCVDKLSIIGNLRHLPKVEANLDYKTLEEAYGGDKVNSYIFDPETIEPYEVALSKQSMVKFQTDRSYIDKILCEAITELAETGTYDKFAKHLQEYELTFTEENNLLHQSTEYASQLKKLKVMLEKEKTSALVQIQQISENIGQLKDIYEDLIFENGIKTRYIDNWENSRLESNNCALDQEEERYLNIINTCKTDIEKEVRIDAEIEAYITEVQQEYEDQIQVWMENYDKEIELRDMEIQVLKEKREEQFIRLEQLAKLFEDHKKEIEQYLEVKEQRRQAAEELQRLNRMATKIQAWWRGVMVRRCLGPYRKKKGKKGDKKGKGKKKGK